MPRLMDDSSLHYEFSGYRYVNINSSDSENGDRSLGNSDDPRVARLESIVRAQREQINQLNEAVSDLQHKLQNLSRGGTAVSSGGRGAAGRTHGSVLAARKQHAKRAVNLDSGVSAECLSPTFSRSTNSLHSDGVSASPSGSPISTPSPTYTQLQQNAQSTGFSLDKRWRSTSDFNRLNKPLTNKPRSYLGSTSNLSRRSSASPGSAAVLQQRRHLAVSAQSSVDSGAVSRPLRESPFPASPRRTVYGSMADISRRRLQQQHRSKPIISNMSYNSEQGSLKIYLKGRPVNLFAPAEVQETYDVDAETPPPEQQLTVDWVFGYRGKDCRNNLYLLPTGELLYFTAGVAVLHQVATNEQRHYTAHTDDIKCMAVHPNRYIVASGQCTGTRPDTQAQVHVWDSVSLATLSVLGEGVFDRSIGCLAFSMSDGGAQLACVDEGHQDRCLSVWNWQTGDKLAENKASTETVVDVQWHPLDEGVLITCGRQHVCFWLLEATEGQLQRKQGVFGGRDRPRYVTCMAFTQGGDLVTGDSEGRLLVWQRGGNQVARTIGSAHEGAVFSLLVSCDGNPISAGKDGRIVEWDSDFNPTDNCIQLPESLGAARVVTPGRDGQLVVGTLRNCIAFADWSAVHLPPLVIGHTDEMWAMAAHPGGAKFVTGAWDCQLVLRNSIDHTVVWQLTTESGVQSCGFSPDGSRLAVGLNSGHWKVIDTESQETVFSRADGEEPIQVIKFSPDGALIAVGSRDNNIYVYREKEDGETAYGRVAKFTGHSSFVSHVDWAADSGALRSNSGDYELLFWSLQTGKQMTGAAESRDLTWASDTCTLTFNTVGIFPEGADGTDVNTCASSTDKSVLASGDDFGKVKLFTYPASHPRAGHRSYLGHSSHVTGVEFSSDGRQLLTCGGRDTTVIQWNVE